MRYEKQTDPFYKTPAWRRLRLVALERDHYICQDCLAQKRLGARIRARRAVVVHHSHNKRPPEKGGTPGRAPTPVPSGVRIIKG